MHTRLMMARRLRAETAQPTGWRSREATGSQIEKEVHLMNHNDFDLPAFLLGNLYDPEEIAAGWTLADAINLAEDIRRYDGIDCDPQEIYEIMLEFARQDAEDAQSADESRRWRDIETGEIVTEEQLFREYTALKSEDATGEAGHRDLTFEEFIRVCQTAENGTLEPLE